MGVRVDLGGEEADEEVEEVNAEAIGDDIEALQEEEDPDAVDASNSHSRQPSPQGIRRTSVQALL